ncbi:glycosyltransferase [Anthropogastromicrobium aceti]|uniref:glycosyltransferase n=1 Tax=Anthropogastromicrobium aceti TaxID=2981768 RepID=UPI000822AF12|nr:glycosyltransferase [Anthropogastromicrobium aceti]MCU6784515.1 glycosyltransferase [Anthropogastromicrobium aceti]SCJ69555.1 Glycosyl transferases group 1 [uncultured Lachnospira sp.]
MNRVFICGYFNFPRGGAAANYVQSFAKVFLRLGKNVIVISNINPNIKLEGNKYQEIQVENVQLREDKLGHYIDFNFLMGKYYEQILSGLSVDCSDLIIAYSRDSFILNSVLKIGKKVGAKTGVCLVEWFEKKDYGKWFRNVEYWKSQISFYRVNLKFDYIFPISTYIEGYYKKKNCKTFRLPSLVDTEEFEYNEKKITDKRIFIFPGNGKMKDALEETIQAFALLRDEEVLKLEFHICGVGKLAKQIIKENKLENSPAGKIVIHEWMPYEELIDLYRRAHFMILARDISRMTLANFPSKIPETLSYGIIPICSRVGDYTKLYLMDGVNSLIMDGCDVQTILHGIRRALAMSDQDIINYSNKCRITAETKFDYKQWVKPLDKFLEKEVL